MAEETHKVIKKLSAGLALQPSKRLVFGMLLRYGALTRNQLAERTGGSQSTVYRILTSLIEDGLVDQSDIAGTGRRPISYMVTPHVNYVFGAYMRWDVFGLGLCAIDGTVIAKERWPLEAWMKPTDLVLKITDTARRFLAERRIADSKILGMNFATTGPLLKEKGILFHPHHVKLPNWDVVPIKDMLEMTSGFGVVVDNLSSASLYGELMTRKTEMYERSAYLLMDEGIGTDMFIPGMIDVSVDDRSGTLGSMIIDLDTERESLSDHVSIDSIYDRFDMAFGRELSNAHAEPVNGAQENWDDDHRLRAIRKLIAGSRGSDLDLCNEILGNIARALGAGISNYVNLLNPGTLFYGGRIAVHLPEMVRMALEIAGGRRPAGVMSDVEFVESRLDDELLIRGGASQVLEVHIGLSSPVA